MISPRAAFMAMAFADYWAFSARARKIFDLPRCCTRHSQRFQGHTASNSAYKSSARRRPMMISHATFHAASSLALNTHFASPLLGDFDKTFRLDFLDAPSPPCEPPQKSFSRGAAHEVTTAGRGIEMPAAPRRQRSARATTDVRPRLIISRAQRYGGSHQ